MNDLIHDPASGAPDPRTRSGLPGLETATGVWPERLWIGFWMVVAVFLRLWHIQDQILTDDEWHALNKLLNSGYFSIVSDFGRYDISIPLTLYYKLLSQTIGLSELSMRLPSLVAGILAVLWIPRLLRAWLGAQASLILVALLAVAPLQIHYSRIARPYAMTELLVWTALAHFFDWFWFKSRRRVFFAACWPLASTLNLPALTSIPGPFLYGLAKARGFSARHRRPVSAVLGTGIIVAFVLTLLLALPILGSAPELSGKLGADHPTWQTFTGVAQLFCGLSKPWLTAVIVFLAVLGFGWLWRRDRQPVVYAATAAVVQVALLVVLAPQRLDVPIAFARYCLWFQPLMLGAAAVGLTRVVAAVSASRALPWLAAPLLAGLLHAGPLPAIYSWPNNWTSHPALQSDYKQTRGRPLSSPFYASLQRRPVGSVLILEAPWYFHHNDFVFTQWRHRQPMMIGFVDRGLQKVRAGEVPREASGVQLRNAVHVADWDGIQRRGIDLVVFHKNLADEIAIPSLPPLPPLPVDDWIDEYRAICGPPEYEDRVVAVFSVGGCQR